MQKKFTPRILDNQTLVVTCKHIQKNVHEDANTDTAIYQLGLHK
jgi:hypothetical protein